MSFTLIFGVSDDISRDSLHIAPDRTHRNGGLTRIFNETRGEYLTDIGGEILAFPLPYDAEQWLERWWLASNGIRP